MKNLFWVASCFMLISVGIIGMYIPAIPQNPAYHHFADENTWLGIPNFWNVVSNFPFLVVGSIGLYECSKISGTALEKTMYWVLFLGILLTGLGSAYYHWQPTNWRLVFDRLPMTLVFMSLFSLVLADIFNPRDIALLFPFLLLLGFFSVGYWYYTETIGQGDLRLYGIVQFLPMLLLPLLSIIYRNRITYLPLILQIIALYGLAKVLEKMDFIIFQWTFLSGHSLKHVFAGLATFLLYKLIQVRKTHTVQITRTK